MLLKGNNILKAGGKFLTVSPDSHIVLKFRVKGTCFPSKKTQGNSQTATYSFHSAPWASNKIYIDFSDGTGWHEYNFYSSGSNRRIEFRNLLNATTPETIQGSNWDDAPVYFYQDLPPEKINTVDDNYQEQRDIYIRFEKPQEIIQISIRRTYVYGSISSAVSRFRNLEVLFFQDFQYVEAFAQDFYNSKIRNLTLFSIGRVMDSGIPSWVVNSRFLHTLDLTASVDLSGDPVNKNLDKINELKDSLVVLILTNAKINYKIPESFTELYKLDNLDLSNNPVGMEMPDNLSGMVSLKVLSFNNSRIPFSEVERVMEQLPALESLDISFCNYSSPYNIDNDNVSLQTIILGGQTWGTGNPPPFINKLKALKALHIYRPGSGVLSQITGWGDFSQAVTIEDIRAPRNENLSPILPTWFDALVNLKYFLVSASFQNTGGIDLFVDSIYELVESNASMTSGNTKFRQMTVDAYGSSAADQESSTRPSGTYQQPSGYVQGSSNGTPASPMEKIWVLSNQYGHTWTVRPA